MFLRTGGCRITSKNAKNNFFLLQTFFWKGEGIIGFNFLGMFQILAYCRLLHLVFETCRERTYAAAGS